MIGRKLDDDRRVSPLKSVFEQPLQNFAYNKMFLKNHLIFQPVSSFLQIRLRLIFDSSIHTAIHRICINVDRIDFDDRVLRARYPIVAFKGIQSNSLLSVSNRVIQPLPVCSRNQFSSTIIRLNHQWITITITRPYSTITQASAKHRGTNTYLAVPKVISHLI